MGTVVEAERRLDEVARPARDWDGGEGLVKAHSRHDESEDV
jgi:hypothetical protein